MLTGFHTDDWITDSRLFRRSAALAVRAGMSREAALKALTMAGAEMLGLEDRIGSLAAGKDADFAILEGDPLSVYCKTLRNLGRGREGLRSQRSQRSALRRRRLSAPGTISRPTCAASTTPIMRRCQMNAA